MSLHYQGPLIEMPLRDGKRLSPKYYSSRFTYPQKRPPILAVVIGINKYASQNYKDLGGAVNDADDVEAFLKNRLQVPSSNILSLRDEEATRERIISSFAWLRDNARYHKDEAAMIIYYAGHGEHFWKQADGSHDEATLIGDMELCPTDTGQLVQVTGEGSQEVIHGIPERTISTLLNQVSDVKGNNITLILDCCRSGGMNERGRIMRRLSNLHVHRKSDEETLSRCSRGCQRQGLPETTRGRYVRLAACGREQRAFEDRRTRRGLFTNSLLKALNGNDFNLLTYNSLMHRMEISERQTPHCEGEGVYWRLFNNQVPGADESLIKTRQGEDSSVILQAGSAQGITLGSRLAAYKTNLIDTPMSPNPPVSYLLVTSVNVFSSTLDFATDSDHARLPSLFYSKLEKRAAVQHIFLYSKDREWLESVFSQVQTALPVTIVDHVQLCDLELSVLGGRVYFDRHNKLVTPWVRSRMPYAVDVGDTDTIHSVIEGWLHFYYHLTRTAPDEFKNVSMELRELTKVTEGFDVVSYPVGKNLIEEEPAQVVVDEDAPLGMIIHNNNSSLELYPYLFYLDPTELTIACWYMPPLGAGAGSVDAPLLPESDLWITRSSEGDGLFRFAIPDGEPRDLGFFRLFLSTRPASFESIVQESPFTTEIARTAKTVRQKSPEMWSVQTVTVVQIRK